MKLSDRIKPISYLKANAPEVIQSLSEHQEPFIITVNGEAKAVLQDIDSYEQTQEAIAMLKALMLTDQQVKEGKAEPLSEAFRRLREQVKKS